ncbi:hypothetical protein PCASD_26029 [Puccinia coronata f. sp. avenae]|uniref:Uncharacterized protein n=1 Tax=Puccinia coronata f. sp. avenae TaxID=200324 RepID=A0A2N5TL75_9BASI|nr:hypothetical protein PCASD_26029 [Puccinia coronata f. sp. avenae]
MQSTHSSLCHSSRTSIRYYSSLASLSSSNSEPSPPRCSLRHLVISQLRRLETSEVVTVADPSKIPGSFLPSTPEPTPDPETPRPPSAGPPYKQEDLYLQPQSPS